LNTLVEQHIQVGELARTHPDRTGQLEQPMLAFAQHAREELEDLVKTLEPPQRGQRGAVGGMLPGAGTNAGESVRVVAGG